MPHQKKQLRQRLILAIRLSIERVGEGGGRKKGKKNLFNLEMQRYQRKDQRLEVLHEIIEDTEPLGVLRLLDIH